MIFEVFQNWKSWDFEHFEKGVRFGYKKWGKSSKLTAFL